MRRLLGVLWLVALVPIAPGFAQENVVKGLYDNAIQLLRQGRPDEALKDLERIYKSYPESEYADEALYRLGQYHLENKQFQAALDSFNLLISSFGDRNMAPEAYHSIGAIYEDVDFPGFDFEKADANFSRVYNIYTRSERVPDALLHSGLIKARLGEFRNARTTLQRLVDEYPQNALAPQALYHLGLILVSQDEPISAMEALQRVIDEYDDKDTALRALRVINNLYRIHILAAKPSTSLYKPDAGFSGKKFKDIVAIAVDSSDNLYVASEDGSNVRVFGPDGTEKQPVPNQKDVRNVFVDGNGELYVVKKGGVFFNGQDHVFRKKTPKGLEALSDVSALVRDVSRTFFVQSSDSSNLLQFDKDENYVGEWPTFKLNDIQDLTIDSRGLVYVIDGKFEKIIRLDATGASKGNLEKKGSNYSMKKLSQVAVDLTGTIYVLDEKDKKVYLFSPDLKLIQAFAPPGLDKPELLTVDSAGTLYVFDSKEGVIRKYL
jgi:TolA-binding protein